MHSASRVVNACPEDLASHLQAQIEVVQVNMRDYRYQFPAGCIGGVGSGKGREQSGRLVDVPEAHRAPDSVPNAHPPGSVHI